MDQFWPDLQLPKAKIKKPCDKIPKMVKIICFYFNTHVLKSEPGYFVIISHRYCTWVMSFLFFYSFSQTPFMPIFISFYSFDLPRCHIMYTSFVSTQLFKYTSKYSISEQNEVLKKEFELHNGKNSFLPQENWKEV